jgi:hypothetical protein
MFGIVKRYGIISINITLSITCLLQNICKHFAVHEELINQQANLVMDILCQYCIRRGVKLLFLRKMEAQ